MGRLSFVFFAMLVLASGCSFGAQGSATAAGIKAKPSMTVTLVRSSQPGCEPNCLEWVVAEGEITAATPAQFRKAFKLAGKDELPVVINSPGGLVEAAMEIGKMIRQRKATVIVAKTIFSGCSPQLEGKCEPASPHRGRYPAYSTLLTGTCMSACVFIFASGTKRIAEPNSIGTHQVVSHRSMHKVWYRETYRMVHGKKKVLSRKIVREKTVNLKPTTKLEPGLRKKFASYFSSMGVLGQFLPLFEKAPPEGMYFLTSSELYGSKIATEPMPYSPIFRKEVCEGRYREVNCVALP